MAIPLAHAQGVNVIRVPVLFSATVPLESAAGFPGVGPPTAHAAAARRWAGPGWADLPRRRTSPRWGADWPCSLLALGFTDGGGNDLAVDGLRGAIGVVRDDLNEPAAGVGDRGHCRLKGRSRDHQAGVKKSGVIILV